MKHRNKFLAVLFVVIALVATWVLSKKVSNDKEAKRVQFAGDTAKADTPQYIVAHSQIVQHRNVIVAIKDTTPIYSHGKTDTPEKVHYNVSDCLDHPRTNPCKVAVKGGWIEYYVH